MCNIQDCQIMLVTIGHELLCCRRRAVWFGTGAARPGPAAIVRQVQRYRCDLRLPRGLHDT
jgi:hypothetical protein